MTDPGDVAVDAHAAARAWVDGWSRAWPVGDVETVSALYAPDAVFYSHPFREPQPPAEYAAWAFAVARDRAAVDWWAVVTARDGSEETLAGTSLLQFGADGLVTEQRDAWAATPGRHPLPDWP